MTGAMGRAAPVEDVQASSQETWRQDPVLCFPEQHPIPWIAGSMALGAAMEQVSTLSTLHAGLVIVGSVGLAVGSRRLPLILAALAYGGVCDVLWRATGGRAPWEASKYLVIVLSVLAILRLVRRPQRVFVPLLLIACLVPGAAATFLEYQSAVARGVVAFVLLSSIAVATSTMLFRQLVVTRREMRGVLWWSFSPCLSVAGMAAWATAKAGKISFGTESLTATTGGFGANQVSSILGLGGVLVLGAALIGGRGKAQLLAASAAAMMVGQALISLSRGGIYGLGIAAIAMLATSLILGGNRGRGIAVLVVGGLLALIAFNWAQGFTGGAAEARFNQNDSGRGAIVAGEVDMFRSHLVSGVGAGLAKAERGLSADHPTGIASHNEFSRLLAEHGLYGLVVIGLMISIAVQAFRRGLDPASRALSVGLVAWSCATMTHSATRIGAVALIFALASLRVEPDRTRPATAMRPPSKRRDASLTGG